MRILIADHQPKVRFALRVVLQQRFGDKAIAEVVDADDLIAQAHVFCPDLVLVDLEVVGMPLADLLAQLHHSFHHLYAIVLSCHAEARHQALLAGADAFVCKCNAPDELLSAIEMCVARQAQEKERGLCYTNE